MIFVVYGQDLFRRQISIAKLKQDHLDPGMEALNLVQVEDPQLAEFRSVLGTPGFGFGKKVIVVKNFNYLENKAEDNEVELVTEVLKSLPDSNIVVFESEKISGTIKLTKQIKNFPNCTMTELKSFNSWEFKPAAIWLREIFPSLVSDVNGSVPNPDLHNLEYFCEQVGVEDSSKLYSELKRLVLFGKPISEDLIDQECLTRNDVFKFARFLAEAKIPQAHKELERIVNAKEIHLGVLALLETVVSKYLKLKLALAERRSDIEIAELLATSPQRLYYQKKEVQQMKESHLDSLLAKILDLEIKVKTGQVTIDRGLRLLVQSALPAYSA